MAKATGNLIGNKIAGKIKNASKPSEKLRSPNNLQQKKDIYPQKKCNALQ